jgi:hypothetical protein
MPDPTAVTGDAPEEPVEEEETSKKGKKKKAKKKKARKPKAKKEKKPREPKPAGAGPGLVAAMTSASPYTVLLAIALLAMTIAVLSMLMQLMAYDGDFKATKAKRGAFLPATIQSVDYDESCLV